LAILPPCDGKRTIYRPKTLRYDYGDAIGYWGGIVGAALAFGALAFGIGLLLGMSWQRRVLLAIVIPVGLIFFKDIGTALVPSVGKFPADAIGALVAVGLCWALSAFAATCFGIRWSIKPADFPAANLRESRGARPALAIRRRG
jgi:hypothetical protein